MKKIEKSIEINASKEKVWTVLFEDQYNRQWFDVFSPGTVAEGDWSQGSKITFKDDSGMGMTGTIDVNRPYEEMFIRFEGIINPGEDVNELPKDYTGGERYRLSGENGNTKLDIATDMPEQYYNEMSSAWDKALGLIKNLAEANN